MINPSKTIRLVAAVIVGLIIGFFVQDYLKAIDLDISIYTTRLSNEQKEIINTELSKVSQDISKIITEQGNTTFAQDSQNSSDMPMSELFYQLPNNLNPHLQASYEYPYLVCKDSHLYPFRIFGDFGQGTKQNIIGFGCEQKFVIKYDDPASETTKYYGPYTF
ncbi:hypothetical protein KA036_02660 [Candidatus Gracilibacteria bacterium]|nr:hypothetical protein [Candidatus Gracilibacteria bacterium]